MLPTSYLETFLLGLAIAVHGNACPTLGCPIQVGSNTSSYNLFKAQSALPQPSGQHRSSTGDIRNIFLFSIPWILAQVSVMWAAWAIGIARCLFPSCSKTAFKLTLDESMKSLHCSEACWSWSSSITHRHFSSITDHPPSKSTLQCPTAFSYKMTL